MDCFLFLLGAKNALLRCGERASRPFVGSSEFGRHETSFVKISFQVNTCARSRIAVAPGPPNYSASLLSWHFSCAFSWWTHRMCIVSLSRLVSIFPRPFSPRTAQRSLCRCLFVVQLSPSRRSLTSGASAVATTGFEWSTPSPSSRGRWSCTSSASSP